MRLGLLASAAGAALALASAAGAALALAPAVDRAVASQGDRSVAPTRQSTALAAARAFPCHWGWSVYDGLLPGYVLAGGNVDCGGVQGSVTLSIQLLARVPSAREWRTVRVKSATWHSLDTSHALEVRQRCVVERVRAIFRWTLRDSAGAVTARNQIRSGSVTVQPGCRIVLR